MRIHILGICGTFMGGLALIAKQMGHDVSGSDANVYPPMSDVLREAGIIIQSGYEASHLRPVPDFVVIGNAMKRGNPAVEHTLNKNIPYLSGPQWLFQEVLQKRHVIAVSGTHGKTTTTSILTWILTHAGFNPGYLIGGVAKNFEHTAALGADPFFVIEADEYDSAFFDKRSKFIHYHPHTLIINNLEYDHADIFPDLEAIKTQFQLLLRTVPGSGSVIYPTNDAEIMNVLDRGCWSATVTFGKPDGAWQAKNINEDGTQFALWHRDQNLGKVKWGMLGQHNVNNALAAIAAAHDVGVTAGAAIAALRTFEGVKRRLEIRGTVDGITVYDDFAHHPTAIETTIAALRAKVKEKRIFVVLEFASNTMGAGVHRDTIAKSLRQADRIVLLRPQQWNIESTINELGARSTIHDHVIDILNTLKKELKPDDHVLIMSNKGFDGIHQKLMDVLKQRAQMPLDS